MVIDYVSSAMDEQDFESLFRNNPKMPGQQAQKYNRLMIQGLAANKVSVHAITGRPVTPENYPGKYLKKQLYKDGKVTWRYGSVLNVAKIKNLWQMKDAPHSRYRIQISFPKISRFCHEPVHNL